MGGHRPVLLAKHRDFVHTRLAAEPELPLRALQRELAERGVKASYGAIWSFVHAEGLSFKKNRSRKRAGPPRHSSASGAVEAASGEA